MTVVTTLAFPLNPPGIKSRIQPNWRGSQVVQDTGLLNRRGVHAPPRVRISPSPQRELKANALSSFLVSVPETLDGVIFTPALLV